MADYHCSPLWEASPGAYGNIDPDELPLSEDLKQCLTAWAHIYDDILNVSDPSSTAFPSAEAETEFNHKGYELADRLKKELGEEFEIIADF
jgi:hypothetical protein